MSRPTVTPGVDPAAVAPRAARSDRYAVIGNPIAHSRSPQIHALFARQTGEPIEYGRILSPTDGFASAVAAFRAAGGAGLNVTVPFKQEAYALATRLTARAQRAAAVNTLVFDEHGVLGDNTDGVGLVRDITQRLRVPLSGARLLLLGAGGASRGVVHPLLEAGVAALAIVNRSASKAHALAADASDIAGARVSGHGYELFGGESQTESFDIVINATSAALSGQAPPVPPVWLSGASLALDMVYGAEPTPFMRVALDAHCACVSDGLGMLVEQAAESFRLWRGVMPQTEPVWAALRAALRAELDASRR
jgi:shikimate dehydrogenase